MIDGTKLSAGSANTYVCALRFLLENAPKDWEWDCNGLLSSDNMIVFDCINILLKNPAFCTYNNSHHNNLSAALQKYMAFRNITQFTPSIKREIPNDGPFSLFLDWMIKEQGLSAGTADSYVSCVRKLAKDTAINYGCNGKDLLSDDNNVVKACVVSLLSNVQFIAYNEEQHGRFNAALQKYLIFRGISTDTDTGIIDLYQNWLLNERGLGAGTCSSYAASMRTLIKTASERWNINGTDLLSEDNQTVTSCINAILCNVQFIAYNEEQHGRFNAALRKYMEFRNIH